MKSSNIHFKSETNICPTVTKWIAICAFASIHADCFAAMYSSIIVCDVNFFRKKRYVFLNVIWLKWNEVTLIWLDSVVSDKYIKISLTVLSKYYFG